MLDWFHLTMRITLIGQLAKGPRPRENPKLAAEVAEELEQLKWSLWHGNVFLALQTIDDLQLDVDNTEHPRPEQQKRLKPSSAAKFGPTGVDPELWAALSIRRGDLQRLR